MPDQQKLISFSEFVDNPVKKFAKFGLDQAALNKEHFRKWLLIWSTGLSTELDELLTALEDCEPSSVVLKELGDVIWYHTSQYLILNRDPFLPLVDNQNFNRYDCVMQALRKSLKRLDYVKKLVRDYTEIDSDTAAKLLMTSDDVMRTLLEGFTLEEQKIAMSLCRTKLNNRYGNAFDAGKSRFRYQA